MSSSGDGAGFGLSIEVDASGSSATAAAATSIALAATSAATSSAPSLGTNGERGLGAPLGAKLGVCGVCGTGLNSAASSSPSARAPALCGEQ